MTSNQPDQSPLLREDADGVATLTLNRPRHRNALSVALLTALQDELDTIAAADSVRVVVIAGNGPVFCAGHDMKEMRASPGLDSQQALFDQCSRMMMTLGRIPQPVIAKVHAPATAAGCQMVASCDLAITVPEATFATPGVHIGLFCSTPMVPLSRVIGRKRALEMLLTGDPITAGQALEYGLVNRVVAAAELDGAVEGLAGKLTGKSPLTLAIGKEAFYRQLDMDLEAAYQYGSDTMARNMMTEDAQEGFDAFLGKRPPRWKGR